MADYLTVHLDTNHERWYRYETAYYSNGTDEWGEALPGHSVVIQLREFWVMCHTPKGVWLRMGYGGSRFVLKSARKRYACPSKEEALVSYIARQRRRISILKSQANDSRIGLRMAEQMLTNCIEHTTREED